MRCIYILFTVPLTTSIVLLEQNDRKTEPQSQWPFNFFIGQQRHTDWLLREENLMYSKVCSPSPSPGRAITHGPLLPLYIPPVQPPSTWAGQCIDAIRGSVSYGPNKPSLPLLDPLVARGCCVFLTDRNTCLTGRDITGEGEGFQSDQPCWQNVRRFSRVLKSIAHEVKEKL